MRGRLTSRGRIISSLIIHAGISVRCHFIGASESTLTFDFGF